MRITLETKEHTFYVDKKDILSYRSRRRNPQIQLVTVKGMNHPLEVEGGVESLKESNSEFVKLTQTDSMGDLHVHFNKSYITWRRYSKQNGGTLFHMDGIGNMTVNETIDEFNRLVL